MSIHRCSEKEDVHGKREGTHAQVAWKREVIYDCTRKNVFGGDVVFRLKGGAYVTNESGTESEECCARPRRLRRRIRMGRRLQGLEEERIRGDSRSGGDDIVRRRRRHH